MPPEMITAFGQFGAMGLMVWYLMAREKTAEANRVAVELKRADADKDRAEVDKALAVALTELTVTVRNWAK